MPHKNSLNQEKELPGEIQQFNRCQSGGWQMKNKCKHFQANFNSIQTLRCIIRWDKIEGLLKEVLKILFLNYSAAFDKGKRNNVVAHWEHFVT